MALFDSRDGGRTWTKCRITSVGGCGYAVALDARDSRVIYVGGSQQGRAALYRSENGGADWRNITGSISGIVADLALDPRTSGTVYAGTPNGFFRSRNGGQSWERKAKFDVAAIKVDPAAPDRIWAGGNEGLYRSEDGGTTWGPLAGLVVDRILCLELDARAGVLYAGTDGGGLCGTAVPAAKPPGTK